MAATLPRRYFTVGGPPSGGALYLTFDDGPHPEHTPPLLDCLAQHQVRATFFVIGRHAEENPRLIKRMADEGHAIGGHTYTHAPRNSQELIQEVVQTRDLVHRLTGLNTPLFRPPLGKISAIDLWRLWSLGQSVVLWNNDPKDYSADSSAELESWFQQQPPRAGDILLFHDNRPHAAGCLSGLIRSAQAQGLRFDTINSACWS